MDFAKRQLEKYGWTEGQGLGKHSTGIKTALKPKIKLDTAGIGHDRAEEFTYRWWEDAFNSAASNINVESTNDGVKVETVTEDCVEISAVKRAKIKRDRMQYGAFLKRETLTEAGSLLESEDNCDPVEEAESRLPKLPATLSDEQLFQACGGLTAHKAARHGHKLSGKLQRVQEQEEALLKALKNSSQKEISSDKSGKKKRKHSDSHFDNIIESKDCIHDASSQKQKPSKKLSVSDQKSDMPVTRPETLSKIKKKKKKKDRAN